MNIHVRLKNKTDADKMISIIKGLPEWFTPNVLEKVARDSVRLEGFVIDVDGVVRGFVLVDERECCVEIM